MSITRFKIMERIPYANVTALEMSLRVNLRVGRHPYVRLNLLTASGRTDFSVLMTKMVPEDQASTAFALEGRTMGWKLFKGIYLMPTRAIRNPNHDEIEHGFIDIEVPEAFGWGKDGGKVHLF